MLNALAVDGDEENTQIALVTWMQMQYPKLAPWLHHSPNGGQRHAATGRRLKRMGTRRGFPDLALYVPRGTFAGLAIELKANNGNRATSEQRQWIEQLRAAGWKAEICYGFTDAQQAITEYVKL